jgi:hypothetical protein
MNNPKIGQYELIIKQLIDSKANISNNINNNIKNNVNNSINKPYFDENLDINNFVQNENITPKKFSGISEYQKEQINEFEKNINNINKKIIAGSYYSKLMVNYIEWINKIKINLINKIEKNNLYDFFTLECNTFNLIPMVDYYDVPETDKLFSFTLFIGNVENLTYFIGLVYNYAIMRKHFQDYKMRLYIDFHSVFGSAETYNLFNMFLEIINDIDKSYSKNLQMIVFFINPFYTINGDNIYDSIVYDLEDVKKYYNNILYNTNNSYIYSPLLNMKNENGNTNSISKTMDNPTNNLNISSESTKNKNNVKIDTENLEINYTNIDSTNTKSTFSMLSCHISVNLRFLPMNEDCEFHVRDLDCRLSLTDKNIINKFNNPKYQYVPFYVFQFYKFYFPYLKWRIDVNPYLAGCFGGNNKKSVMISKSLEESENMKILKKELFFKYILFISFNATNLQIGFLNDEFILANIFEKIKGTYSENVLFLNLGSFANKHVNEYYYALNKSNNYPCILKLGIPIDILRYPLNGKYLTVDPITDFKIGNIPLRYHSQIKELVTEQVKKYLGYCDTEKNKLTNVLRNNYKIRLNDEINDDLEAALYFSMIPQKYKIKNIDELNEDDYTSQSYSDANQYFSSVGQSTMIVNNEKLKATNFMMAGYLLADILEDIIFPNKPEFINSNYYLSEDNFDRLFNCLYFDEEKSKFLHKKINKKDISRKYIDQNIIDIIPTKYLEFNNKNEVKDALNTEFNEYLKTSFYYPSMSAYVNSIKYSDHININNNYMKSGTLLFIKNYDNPIYDENNNIINNINNNDVKILKYSINKTKKEIESVNINKNKLRFNLLFIDDKNINQLVYHNENNKSEVNIKLVKSSQLNNLLNFVKQNNYDDYLIVDNL